jgi:hypothetical protein
VKCILSCVFEKILHYYISGQNYWILFRGGSREGAHPINKGIDVNAFLTNMF